MRCNTAGAYTLQDTVGGLFHRDVSRHHLKVVTSDAFAKDFGNTQYVSDIVRHEVRDGRVHYLTKFVGFPDPEWVPEENIDDKDLIRQYLSSAKLIPAKLKNLHPIDPARDPMLASHNTVVTAAKSIQEIVSPATTSLDMIASPNASSSSASAAPTIPSGALARHHRARKPSQAVLESASLLAHSTCPFFPNVQDLSI
jgi:hypothetical protein